MEELVGALLGGGGTTSLFDRIREKDYAERSELLAASYLAMLETLCIDHEIGPQVQQIVASTFHGQRFVHFLGIGTEDMEKRAKGESSFIVDALNKKIGETTATASMHTCDAGDCVTDKLKKAAELARVSVTAGAFVPFMFVCPDAKGTAQCRKLIRTGQFETWKADPLKADAPKDVE